VASRIGSVLTLLVAALALNFALGFYNYWPTPWIVLKPQFSIEAVLLILALVVFAWWRGPLSRRGAAWLALALMIAVVGRYIDVTAPALYGRPINLYWDSQHLPAVAAMFARAASWWQLMAAALVGAVAFAALYWLLRLTVQRLVSATARKRSRRWLASGSMALLSVWALTGWLEPALAERWFTRPVTVSWAQQFNQLRLALSEEVARDFALAPLPQTDLSMIKGADVIVMFIESYGATAVDKPAHAAALAPAFARLQRAVTDTGRHVASGRVTSPTFGGGSWLAHASFLAGYEVRDGSAYKLLLASERHTWIQSFAAAGYRTIGLLPGIRMAWPEGEFYGFDKIYDASALDYRGIEFGWWAIPDQYSLAKLTAQEMSTTVDRQPVLTFFTTISSHAPFRPVAPYKSDWSALLGPTPYQAGESASALGNRPDWMNLSPSYLESIEYAIDIVAGYLKQRSSDDLTMVIIGDHQPTASVTGPQATWQVPLHIISNRQPVIDALVNLGLSNDTRLPAPGQGPMHEFSATLLNVFGGSVASQPGVDISRAVARTQPGQEINHLLGAAPLVAD